MALATDEFGKAFEELKTKDEVFGKYPTVEALTALCRPGGSDPGGRDRALTFILSAMRSDNAIFPLLFRMFWDSLEAIYRGLCRRTADPESLFDVIQWEFFQGIVSWDPKRLPSKIDVNIVLNTRRAALIWLKQDSLEAQELQGAPALEGARLSWRALEEVSAAPEDMEAFLLDLQQRGVLDPVQVDLILEADVHRRMSVYGWAREKGLPGSTAHEYRQRAFQAICKHLAAGREQP